MTLHVKELKVISKESNLLGKDCKEVLYFMCHGHIYLAINLTVKYPGTIRTCTKFAKRTDSTCVYTP